MAYRGYQSMKKPEVKNLVQQSLKKAREILNCMEARDLNCMEARDLNCMEARDLNCMEAHDLNCTEARDRKSMHSSRRISGRWGGLATT